MYIAKCNLKKKEREREREREGLTLCPEFEAA